VRENLLRDLASRAAKDPAFLRQARKDLEDTLARHGYRLTGEKAGLGLGLSPTGLAPRLFNPVPSDFIT
jgi:hypothetical protein